MTRPQTHAAPLQARGGMAAFELVEADRIDAQARPKEPAFLMVGGATRAEVVVTRRPLSRVIFASSNAGVILAHRGESCRPGVVSIEPDMGDAVRFFKASGSEAEGLEARLRWGIAPVGLAFACSRPPGSCRMPRWPARHVACDAQHARPERFPCHPSPNSLPRFKRANTRRPQVPD